MNRNTNRKKLSLCASVGQKIDLKVVVSVQVKVKVKVKFTLEQANKAQRGSIGIYLLFL